MRTAGRNRRQRQRSRPQFIRQFQAALNCGGQPAILISSSPNRANRLDHIPTGQLPRAGIGRLFMAGRSMRLDPDSAFGPNRWSALTADSLCDPAAVRQPWVSRIDHRIDPRFGQVAVDPFQSLP